MITTFQYIQGYNENSDQLFSIVPRERQRNISSACRKEDRKTLAVKGGTSYQRKLESLSLEVLRNCLGNHLSGTASGWRAGQNDISTLFPIYISLTLAA